MVQSIYWSQFLSSDLFSSKLPLEDPKAESFKLVIVVLMQPTDASITITNFLINTILIMKQ